ncbi:CoA pyrophosphatase [Leptospira idonii]|uniref:CoA pyrophosphatase n=2 Tax=Leptospira idonii TaxID=1193500 RepID=A0A4R9M3Z5_9LEPT|nr:CoA pyrophosphatase [Leptospira idonii]TGN20447.1 CoA pyrophosphatase [Leptospira idonii]
MLDLTSLSEKLSQDWKEKPDTNETVSSVIIPIFHDPHLGQGLILQQRSVHLKSHPGQIAFPGGVMEEGDADLLDCALREWEEEMGVPRSRLQILGRYAGLKTRTGYHITPFVGLYEGELKFSCNIEEVERTITLPLQSLFTLPFYALKIPNRKPEEYVYYFDLEDGLLWGATCEIILRFLKEFAHFDRKPKLVAPNLSQPPFLDPKRL